MQSFFIFVFELVIYDKETETLSNCMLVEVEELKVGRE